MYWVVVYTRFWLHTRQVIEIDFHTHSPRVVKLVYTVDSKSIVERRVGSSPTSGTNLMKPALRRFLFVWSKVNGSTLHDLRFVDAYGILVDHQSSTANVWRGTWNAAFRRCTWFPNRNRLFDVLPRIHR